MGFRAGIDLGAGPAEAAVLPAGEAAAAGAAATDPATCSASTCEEPPAAAKTTACKLYSALNGDNMIVNPTKKAACEFGFDTGFMVMCGQACEDPAVDKEIFKSEDVVRSTCDPGVDKKPCSDGFRGGVDAGAAIGSTGGAAAAVPDAPNAKIRAEMKKRHQEQEEKRSARTQAKKDQTDQKKQEEEARKKKQEEVQRAEVERQIAQVQKREVEAEQKRAAESEDGVIMDGKAKAEAVKAVERKRLQDAEEAGRIKWLKAEEEAERLAELAEEAELEKRMVEARAEAAKKLKDRGKRSKEQIKRDKKIADEYAKEQKKKKKRNNAGGGRM
jgi:hypothetical protein